MEQLGLYCIENWHPNFLVFTSEAPRILYYSHFPAIIVSLFLGFFVFLKERKLLLSKILLSISVVFSLWTFTNLIAWTNDKSTIISFFWSFFGILYLLLYALCLYFVYVFVDKKDISFNKKLILGILFFPVIIFSFTKFNLSGFDLSVCESIESKYYLTYYHLLGIAIFVWTIILAILRYKKAEKEFKKQILLLMIGMGLFLVSFFVTGYVASLIDNFELEQYGLFSMTAFMGFLAYLIVKYKAFNIKLLGAQALVAVLVILIGSEFFFMPLDNVTNIVLISVTLLLSVVFGWYLIESVKLEVQRKEELQLMSNKLAEANDKLRKLDNAKSEFISIASHQLRTPLTAIKGFVSLLLEGSYGKLEAKQEEAMNKVYVSNERLINLVEDLLNISRIESGRMEFKLAPTKMEDLCQEVIDTFVLRAKEKKLYLHYNKPETPLPELMIDVAKVKEVVSNITDNALKYSPKGGVTLRLERRENPNSKAQIPNKSQNPNDQNSNSLSGEMVRVTVSDTGIGIPKEELPYLFTKFSRGKDTGRLNAGGTGLGLYVGKEMIEANGGKIWAESDGQGKGSRFIIELPVQQSKELLERWG